MYTVAVPDADLPVKNASGLNRKTSSVPGSRGTEVATAPALAIASAEVEPTPKNTVTVLSLMILN
jgi:hypothetical protein